MVKIEQTGGRLTEEEILHGKEDAYGIYQINIYEKIPEERMHGRKGIGIDLHFPEENLYPGKCSLFEGGEICREFLDIVPFYKENKEVQKAVNYLENHFNKKEKSLMKPKKPEQAPRL